MKIRIDKSGYLDVERAGVMFRKQCPFIFQGCGDWCALFGEPVHNVSIGELSGVEIDLGWHIEICQGRVLHGEITDERGGG